MSSHTMTHLCAQKVAGGTFTYIKALLTLWFDDSRISQIQDNLSKTKQRKRPKGCFYMPVIGVGLSTLLVPTNWAMREPLNRGTGNRHGSTFFCMRT